VIFTKKLYFFTDRKKIILFQGNTAQTANGIKLNFIPNESLLKMGFMSITDNPYDDYGLENYGILGIWLGTSMGNQ
jgi:hypothetical protein